MSIAKNASRFDFLPDDAGDPFESSTKKNKKKDGSSGSGDASKKKSGKKNSSNTDRKQLQSLAFGSASEGKKKSTNKTSGITQQNGCNNIDTGTSTVKDSSANSIPSSGKEEKNGNCTDKNVPQRPKAISKEQWEQWRLRDADFADEAYATDLQNALLQSKLEFETELKNKPLGKWKKKKPVAVPLNEFNARLNDNGSSTTATNCLYNGTMLGQNPSFGSGSQNFPVQQSYETDEELVERFRMEAKLEIERERQKAINRQLLMSRQPPPATRPTPVQLTSPSVPSPVDEKDVIISRLTEENLHLKGEVDLLKDRVKSINTYLQAAQEVKDKAKLIYELDNMTKANSDLNEELRQVHSQLEQEKSRSGAAMLELRRLLENRRRTTTEGSTS